MIESLNSIQLIKGRDATSKISIENCLKYDYLEEGSPKCPVLDDNQPVTGIVYIGVRPGAKIEHQGITLSLIGQIEFRNGGSGFFGDAVIILNKKLELNSPGILRSSTELPFSFEDLSFMYESYSGTTVQLRYYLKLICSQSWNVFNLGALPSAQQDLLIHKYSDAVTASMLNPMKMEVGIESCLHIEFEFQRRVYHLQDVIEGKVRFLLAKLRLRYMELDILRTETVHYSDSHASSTDTEVISRYEIMDGPPHRYAVVPVRFFIGGQKLTASFDNCMNKFSVKYFLNLVLVDEEDRRYFKRQEITMIRARKESEDIEIKDRQASIADMIGMSVC